jgi:hypothetical protein
MAAAVLSVNLQHDTETMNWVEAAKRLYCWLHNLIVRPGCQRAFE